MSEYKIIEVKDKAEIKQFFNCARNIYADDPNWVCPLDIETNSIFDPKHNSSFKYGDARRWIVFDSDKQVVGRIGAFYHREKALKSKPYSGGVGFFECINDQNIADLLFDTAREWLKSEGMEAMDGPINFGENFLYWGLLIEGYTHQAYGMQYHKPYYKKLFETYGFQNYFNQFSYHVDLTKPFNERQAKFAKFLMRKGDYRFEHLKMAEKDRFVDEVTFIFNEVWSDFHEDYTPLDRSEITQILNDAKDIINEEFIWFAYDADKPIGMVIAFPDVNQIIKPFKGNLNLINKLRFLQRRKNPKVVNRARLLISGMIPDYQRSGIIGPLFLKMAEYLKKHGVTELEMSWVGEYNHAVNKIYKQMDNAEKAKTHATFRYLFDRSAEFERFNNEVSEKTEKVNNNE